MTRIGQCRRVAGAAGLLGLALLLGGGCGRAERVPSRYNLLLVSIDTLRADHLGCYGYDRPTSPFLDSLAARPESVLFEQCISQAPNTAPSHTTIMTSLDPQAHGVANLLPGAEHLGAYRHRPETRTLAQVLRDAGYATAGITDGGALDPAFGLDQGFDAYTAEYEGAAAKVDEAVAWLEEHAGGAKPFFLFLHTYEVHAPYRPPQPFHARFAPAYEGWLRKYCDPGAERSGEELSAFRDLFKMRASFTPEDVGFLEGLYDGEVAYTDHELGRLWDFLKQAKLLERTVVVVLSDHGEEFGEHREFGHKQLFDEVLRVPFLVRLPGAAPRPARSRVPDQVALLDVMPTVLDLLGVDPPPEIQGRSLVPLLKQGGAAESRPAYAALMGLDPAPLMRAVRTPSYKLLWNGKTGRGVLLDLAEDPAEQRNRFYGLPRVSQRYGRLLRKWGKACRALRERYCADRREKTEADLHLMETLKQLGY